MHVFASTPNLSAVDAWIPELQTPDAFISKHWGALLDTTNAISLRSSKGKTAKLPEASWQEYKQEFYDNGMSLVVRREHMGVEESALESAIKDTMRTTGASTHAYLSAGQAHALEPHVDP